MLNLVTVVTAFNRPQSVIQTLESVVVSEAATKFPLVISIDGARSELEARASKETVEAVHSWIDLKGKLFPSIELIVRPHNIGLRGNVLGAVNEAFQRFEYAVILEDDIVVDRYFYSWITEAISDFAEVEGIWSFSGYVVPQYRGKSRYNLAQRISSWGWACSRRKWHSFCEMQIPGPFEVLRAAISPSFQNTGRDKGFDLWNQALFPTAWAVMFEYARHLADEAVVYPPHSLVENLGNRTGGTHSRRGLEHLETTLKHTSMELFAKPALLPRTIDVGLNRSLRESYPAHPKQFLAALKNGLKYVWSK